jgi:NADPH2:quinone reductase
MSMSARAELRGLGEEHVVRNRSSSRPTRTSKAGSALSRPGSTREWCSTASAAKSLAPRPHVPQHSTIYFYGFLSGRVPISIATSLLMWKNLVMKPFSNFESATVEDSQTLDAALADLQALIDDELSCSPPGSGENSASTRSTRR